MNYLAVALFLSFNLCVQSHEDGAWRPDPNGAMITIRIEAVRALLRTEQDVCTGVVIGSRAFYVAGPFMLVRGQIEGDDT